MLAAELLHILQLIVSINRSSRSIGSAPVALLTNGFRSGSIFGYLMPIQPAGLAELQRHSRRKNVARVSDTPNLMTSKKSDIETQFSDLRSSILSA